ncbi:GlsB/YeaQ/YmgE family stress response membrane protein [Rubneribacter sp.]|nr:GlsB/YeaQ/YmgE family stress response membrane protein [Candidatus Rubneribacter avistercoris]
MSIIVWIIIGGLAGWIANMIMKTDGSLIKNIVTGIVGALVGGFVMSFFGAEGFTGFNLWSFLVALVGSIILIAVINLLTGGKRA